jgi:hypothetical protein
VRLALAGAGLGAARGLALVHRRDQHRQAQRVGQQHEFLPLVAAQPPGVAEEADAVEPFGLGQPCFAGEGVQVLHQAGHQLAQARLGRLGMAGDDGLCDGVFVDVAHGGKRQTQGFCGDSPPGREPRLHPVRPKDRAGKAFFRQPENCG